MAYASEIVTTGATAGRATAPSKSAAVNPQMVAVPDGGHGDKAPPEGARNGAEPEGTDHLHVWRRENGRLCHGLTTTSLRG